MICKACGTEYRGKCCPRCGELHEGDISPTSPVTPTRAEIVPVASDADNAQARASRKTKKRVHHRAAPPRVKVRLRQIFFPSLLYFLPLLYLFTDAFVVYTGGLQLVTEEGTVLHVLVMRLLDAAFAANPLSDVIAATVGGDTALFTLLSVKDILTAPASHPCLIAPAVILAFSALMGAVCGVMMLFTAGKALRVRPLADLAVGGGFFAALAPLLADLAFRLYHVANGGVAAADAAISCFGLSVEVMLAGALSLIVMLPAVRAIRRAVGGQGVYLTAPQALLCKSLYLTRLLGVIFAFAATVLPFVTLLLTVSDGGTLLEVFFAALEGASGNALAILEAFFMQDAPLALEATLGLFTLPILPLMLLFTLPAFLSILHLLLTSSVGAAIDEKRQRALLKTGKRLRRVPALLLILYVLFGIVALLIMLWGTRAHVDPANVDETLALLYLLLAFVRGSGRLYTAGILTAALSLVLSNVAGGFARGFVALSLEKHR